MSKVEAYIEGTHRDVKAIMLKLSHPRPSLATSVLFAIMSSTIVGFMVKAFSN